MAGMSHPREEKDRSYMPMITLVVFLLMIAAVVVLRISDVYTAATEENPIEPRPPLEDFLSQIIPPQDDVFSSIDDTAQGLGTEALTLAEETIISRDGTPTTLRVSKPEGAGPFAGIVLVHGGSASTQATERTAQIIQEGLPLSDDVIIAAVDWRDSSYGQGDRTDVVSTIDWLQQLPETDGQPVVVLGLGHGGYLGLSSVDAATVDGVAAVYSYTDLWQEYQFLQSQNEQAANNFLTQSGCDTAVNVEGCLANISLQKTGESNVPVLLIHSTGDTVVPSSQSQQLFDTLPESQREIFIIDDENVPHDFMILDHPDATAQALRVFTEWMNAIQHTDEVPAAVEGASTEEPLESLVVPTEQTPSQVYTATEQKIQEAIREELAP